MLTRMLVITCKTILEIDPVALYPSGRALLAGGDIDLKEDGSATFTGTVSVGGLNVGGSSVDTSAQVDAKISALETSLTAGSSWSIRYT